MIHKVYSIYDSKAEVYTLPYFSKMEAEAIRYFSNWVNDPNHQFGKNPEDYTLFYIGEYDDNLGTFEQSHQESKGVGIQYIRNEESVQ